MGPEGEEKKSSLDFVEQVTPFPMAEDLLLLAKESVSETALVSLISDAREEAATKEVQPLQPLRSDQPYSVSNAENESGESISETALVSLISDAREEAANKEVQPLQPLRSDQPYSVSNAENESGLVENGERVGAIEEDRPVPAIQGKEDGVDEYFPPKVDVVDETASVIEKIALFEGLIVSSDDGTDETVSKRDDKSFQSEGLKQESAIFEGPRVDEPSGVALENDGGPENGTISSEERELEVSEQMPQEDSIFQGLTIAEPSNVARESVGTPEVGNEFEEERGGIGTLTGLRGREREGFEEIILVNGTHRLETLGEIFTKERQEKESREGVKGAGEGTSSRASSDQNAQFVAEHVGSTSQRPQLNNDAAPTKNLRPAVPTSDGNEIVSHRPSASGTNIVGDILYNIAVGDEEGRSRQRILAFAAKRYAANVERNPNDHDALYNWALVLQESADNAGSEMGPPGKDALLDEACKKYDAATQLCPTLHEAYYNWAIAISDRAKIRGRTKEAEELWKQACDRYNRSVQLNWNSPQALNNWGLALQELGAIVALKEKRAIVKKAIRKFRAAIQLRFDFHRAVYNLGTVLYGLAEDTLRSGRKLSSKEPTPADLYSLSAIYIAAAHALKPDYPVYRGALRLVRSMLPLPYMRAGWLRIAPTGDSLAPHSDWLRLWFVLDHEAFYEMEKVDRKSLAHSYSRRPSAAYSESSTASTSTARPSVVRIEMEDVQCLSPCADLSLPPGGGFCIDTVSGPQYLIADTWDGMDAWVDAVRLVYTIYAQGKRDSLASVLAG